MVRHARFVLDLRAALASSAVDATLDGLFGELDMLWRSFDRELRQGKLKQLDFDSVNKTITWHRPKAADDEALQKHFYAKLLASDMG